MLPLLALVGGHLRRDAATSLPSTLSDDWLKVGGNYVMAMTNDGHFEIDKNITKVYLDIGVWKETDFKRDLLSDPHLLVFGIDANPDAMRAQAFTHERFKLFNFAAGDNDKYIEFNINGHPGCSSVLKGNTDKFNNSIKTKHDWLKNDCIQTNRTVRVPMRRLDHFIARIPSQLSVDWVKIDAQGYDFEVMKSIGSELKRVRKLQFETQLVEDGSPDALYEGAAPFSKIEGWIREQGFPKARCNSFNGIQKAIKEVDCITCRGVVNVTKHWRRCRFASGL